MNIHNLKLWIETSVFAVIVVFISLSYQYLQTGSVNPILLNRALAFSALFMINLSFILSGTSYFWALGKSKLGYRKMIGVIGFIISLIHASLAANIFGGSPLWFLYIRNNPMATIPAFFAIVIMAMMVGVSNWGIPARLGAVLWRKLLRVGYIAIIFLVVHVTLLSVREWIGWFQNGTPILPPLSLLIFLFSLLTLGMRVALFIALKKKKSAYKPAPSNNPPVNQERV